MMQRWCDLRIMESFWIKFIKKGVGVATGEGLGFEPRWLQVNFDPGLQKITSDFPAKKVCL